MRQRIAVAILTSFFLSLPAQAEMKLFPMWEQKKCPSETFACYNFDTTKKILKIDLDLQLKLDKLDACLKDKTDLQLSFDKLKESNEKLTGINTDLETRLKEKQVVLEENTLALVKSEGSSVWNNLHWIVIIVVVAAGGAFAGGYYLGSR